MNKIGYAFALGLGLAAFSAQAQTVVSDTDGNGVYSIEEMTAASPEIYADLFAQIDVDGNGAIDADELQAAREAGTIAN